MAEPDIDQRVLQALADGDSIDWDHVETVAPGGGKDLLALGRVVAFQRRLAAAVGRHPLEQRSHWGPLALIEHLGSGSFGDVYKAWDPELEREVALKLFRLPAGAVDRRDAVREGRLLARVHHRHVVTVFGAAIHDGVSGIWMELVRGRTLDDIVVKDGPMSAAEAATAGAMVCNALSALHSAGIGHGDVKAQNVMREDGGRLVLMDLSAARNRDAADSADQAGTFAYLAPERLTGAAPSVAADLYSVGVLLYYLATAQFPSPSHPSLRDARAHLPAAFVSIVERSMAASPADRFANASEMERALLEFATRDGSGSQPGRHTSRRVMPLATTLLATFVAVGLWQLAQVRPAAPSITERDWVLVAKFDDQTAVTDDAVEVMLAHALGESQHVNVVPPGRVNDALRLMRKPPVEWVDAATARDVALRDPEIKAIVTGRIDKAGHGFQVSAQIVEPESGRTIGGARENAATVAGLPRAASDLASRLQRLLGDNAGATRRQGQRAAPVTTPSVRALQLYSDAVTASDRRKWEAAAEFSRLAVSEDPDFASAWAWLALCQWVLQRRTEAQTTIEKALSLSKGTTDRERLFITGFHHYFAGRREEAVGAFLALLQRYPDDVRVVAIVGPIMSGPQASRVPLYTRAADLQPNNHDANVLAVLMLISTKGDLQGAKPYVARALAALADGTESEYAGWLSLFPALERWLDGDAHEAARILEQTLDRHRTQDVYRGAVAGLYLAMGQIRRVREVQARVPNKGPSYPVGLATLAYFVGDRPAMKAALEADVWPPGRFESYRVWYATRAGLLSKAEQLARGSLRAANPAAIDKAIAGEVARARGQLDEAEGLLKAAFERIEPGGFPSLMIARSYAEVLAKQGRPEEAVRVLEEATRDPVKAYHTYGASLVGWVDARSQLVQVLRESGQPDAADKVAAPLRKMLALADPEFQPALRLK